MNFFFFNQYIIKRQREQIKDTKISIFFELTRNYSDRQSYIKIVIYNKFLETCYKILLRYKCSYSAFSCKTY